MTRISGVKPGLLLLILFLSNCAPLTKTQVKLTVNYFETITSLPNHCRDVNYHLADLSLNSRILESALINSDSQRVASLVDAISVYENQLEIPDSLALHLQYLETYIQTFFILIPDGFDAYKALKTTSQSVGGFFGLGGVISAVLPDVSTNVKPARKRKIKGHIENSSDSLKFHARKIIGIINYGYLPHLELIDKESRKYFQYLFDDIQEKPDPVEYYTNHNRLLVDYYQNLYNTKQISQLLVKTLQLMLSAQDDIILRLEERAKINPEIARLSELVRNLQKIKKLHAESED